MLWCILEIWLLPVRNVTTTTIINALKQKIFATFLVPEVIVSDEAKCFVSVEFKRSCFSLGIQNFTTSYYSQPSHAEMLNRNLRATLITYFSTSQRRWEEDLPWLQVVFNMASHDVTAVTLSKSSSHLGEQTLSPIDGRFKTFFQTSLLFASLAIDRIRWVEFAT